MADEEDLAILRKLGVKGDMVWIENYDNESVLVHSDEKSGVFNRCECTKKVLDILEDIFPAFWRGCFRMLSNREYRNYLGEK
ncbi:hypothetical protein LCGC14_0466270 [marine sediment metagenome]|uniref:Uncharacterized protein n=1 Tax=marine sediment metagenome TaxID=412755 RepID=A0A0F9SWF8_9ZZZZ